MRRNESLQPLSQTTRATREHFIARWAGALRYPATSFETVRSWLSTRKLSRMTLLDIFERAVVVLVFGHFAFVMLTAPEGTAGILSIILLVSESLPVFLILTRRQSKALSDKTVDWLLALIGTILPLLAVPIAAGALASPGLCGAIMLIGLYVQIFGQTDLGAQLWPGSCQPRYQSGGPLPDRAPPYLCGLHDHSRGIPVSLPLIIERRTLFHRVGDSNGQAFEGRATA